MGFTKWMLPKKEELKDMIEREPETVLTLAKRDAIIGPDNSVKMLNNFLRKRSKTV